MCKFINYIIRFRQFEFIDRFIVPDTSLFVNKMAAFEKY